MIKCNDCGKEFEKAIEKVVGSKYLIFELINKFCPYCDANLTKINQING